MKYCNIRILTKEDINTENNFKKIMKSIVKVQNQLQNFKGKDTGDSKNAIIKLKNEISKDL